MTEEPIILDTVAEPSVTDPLSDVTRRDRKALLAACIVGLAISAGGLVPEKIETFGITVSAQQEESLLYILAGVIAYFLVAFAVYSWSDLKHRDTIAAKHRARLRPMIEELTSDYRKTQNQPIKPDPDEVSRTLSDPAFLRLARLSDQIKFAQRVQLVGTLRIAVDVYFPMVAGVTAIMVVWSSTGGFPGWSFVALGALAASLFSAAFLLSWRRREIYRWWRKRRNEARRERQKRLMKRAQALQEGDPKKAKLLAEARDLLMKSVEDLREGIF